MTNKTILITSIIAMTFLIGFAANEAYAGQVPCECSISIEVDIDIKPGSDPNSINPSSRGVVPVAILTTDDFDASTVDPYTLSFMAADDVAGGVPNCVGHNLEDVDDDGDLDLVCKFLQQETWIRCDTTLGVIFGQTIDGQGIIGFDSINPVGKDLEGNKCE